MKRLAYIFIALILLIGILPVKPALGQVCSASVVVANTNDSGLGSLRQALLDVCTNGTITFEPGLSGTVITLASQLTLDKNVKIDGSTLLSKLTISGNDLNRVFLVPSGSTVTLESLIIAHGKADNGGTNVENFGGGIYNVGGTLTVENCLLSNNYSGYLGGAITNSGGGLTVVDSTFSSNNSRIGGAIFNGSSGSLTVISSTLSHNTARTGGGGGIYNELATLSLFGSTVVDNAAQPYYGGGIFNMSGSVTVANSTFSGNSASGFGAAIANFGFTNNYGNLTLYNSTLSGNSGAFALANIESWARLHFANTIVANTSGGSLDCYNGGNILTNINNLIENEWSCLVGAVNSINSDPQLGPLTLIPPGTTPTFPLLTGSPTINAGDNAICSNAFVNGLDQRGVARPQGATCDIGAYEQKLSTNDAPAFTSTSTNTGTQGVLYSYDITTSIPEEGDSHTITASTKPAWLTFVDHGDGTATLSGVPTNANVGNNSVSLVVADTYAASSSQEFTINVINTNDPPAFTSTSITSATQGVLYSYAITTSDPDIGDSLSISASTKPTWLTLVDHGDGTATLSGTPANADVGDNSVTLVVIDTYAETSSQEFTINVANTNDPPAFTSTAVTSGTQGVLYSYAITTSDPDLGDSLTITASTMPAWLTHIDHGDGTATLSGTPTLANVGSHSVKLVVTDSKAANSAQEFTIIVQTPANYTIFLPMIRR